ncbi:sensor histidine kinase [Maritalea sp.]|uniref:sensor histidine kinase n=1 Tax=Maritalea sp. TaxID=2003361 RepID=UPI003EF3714E
MKRQTRRTFASKILRGVLLITLTNLIFVIAVLAFARPTLVDGITSAYLSSLGEFIKEDARYALLVRDESTTETYVAGIAKLPWIEVFEILDEEGRRLTILGETNWKPDTDEYANHKSIFSVNDSSHLIDSIVVRDRSGSDEVIGYFHIAVNRTPLNLQADRAYNLIIGAIFVGSIFIWMLTSSMAFRSTKSIRLMNSEIGKLQPEHSELIPIDVLPDSVEFVNAQDGINALIRRMGMYRDDVEGRVRERTLELASSLERNREIEAVRRSLIMNLSHDLKTPLTANLGYINLAIEELEDGGETGDFEKSTVLYFLEKSKLSSLLLSDEIRTLLQYSAATDNFKSLELENIDVESLVKESIFVSAHLCSSSENDLVYNHIGRSRFITSPRLIKYIIDGMISNAHKACKRGAVTITTEVIDGQLSLVVHDTGTGIAADEIEKIFDSHFSGSSQSHVGPRGMGIGLSLTRFWVDQLHGEISVATRVGEFTQFTVSIREGTLFQDEED